MDFPRKIGSKVVCIASLKSSFAGVIEIRVQTTSKFLFVRPLLVARFKLTA
jgi:hypothetical protein